MLRYPSGRVRKHFTKRLIPTCAKPNGLWRMTTWEDHLFVIIFRLLTSCSSTASYLLCIRFPLCFRGRL